MPPYNLHHDATGHLILPKRNIVQLSSVPSPTRKETDGNYSLKIQERYLLKYVRAHARIRFI